MAQRLLDDAVLPLFEMSEKEYFMPHIYPREDVFFHVLHETCWCRPIKCDTIGGQYVQHFKRPFISEKKQ